VTAAPAFEFVDRVTSDLCFVARGASVEDVFAASAEALLAATVEDPGAVTVRVRRSLALEEPALDLLLLRFLNELIYWKDAEQLLLRPETLRVSQAGAARLEAQLAGERIDPGRHRLEADVKAATAHGLRVGPGCGDGAWEAAVTLDV
jgi:SHS2 domain-containing protein